MAVQCHNFALQVEIAEVLSRLSTSDVQAVVVAAIDILDSRENDCDLEDDDPSGDPLEILGECQSDDGREVLAMLPKYGADQTLGPINEADARQAHYRMERLAA